jgi:hypothetical protein
MERISGVSGRILFGAVSAVLLLASGCSKSKEETIPAARQETLPADTPPPPTFTAVDQALKAGSFDDAAARLFEMRASGKEFSNAEAAEYRRKLNEAYAAALEAAERGDPRAKAAIELIRANPGR